MASLSLPLATAISIVLLFLTATATARPCRSFIMSSYTFRNPSSNTFTTITEFRSLTPLLHHITTDDNNNNNNNNNMKEKLSIQIIDNSFFDSSSHHHNNNFQLFPHALLPRAQSGFSTSNSNTASIVSLRNRTKDILSVFLALLFGVGCGSLTAATMYFGWSVLAGLRDYRGSGFDDFSSSDDDSEVETPKKLGYEKIPAAEAAAAPPVAKDVV